VKKALPKEAPKPGKFKAPAAEAASATPPPAAAAAPAASAATEGA
jgi:hypothetical protein